jgi:hypothetical protein
MSMFLVHVLIWAVATSVRSTISAFCCHVPLMELSETWFQRSPRFPVHRRVINWIYSLSFFMHSLQFIPFFSWIWGFHCWNSIQTQQMSTNRKFKSYYICFFLSICNENCVYATSLLEICALLFFCATELFSYHRDNMKAFDLAILHMTCICCIVWFLSSSFDLSC